MYDHWNESTSPFSLASLYVDFLLLCTSPSSALGSNYAKAKIKQGKGSDYGYLTSFHGKRSRATLVWLTGRPIRKQQYYSKLSSLFSSTHATLPRRQSCIWNPWKAEKVGKVWRILNIYSKYKIVRATSFYFIRTGTIVPVFYMSLFLYGVVVDWNTNLQMTNNDYVNDNLALHINQSFCDYYCCCCCINSENRYTKADINH